MLQLSDIIFPTLAARGARNITRHRNRCSPFFLRRQYFYDNISESPSQRPSVVMIRRRIMMLTHNLNHHGMFSYNHYSVYLQLAVGIRRPNAQQIINTALGLP